MVHIKEHQTQQGDKMVFIDLDDKYPRNLISITIYENVLNQLKPAIYGFLNKTVAVKGRFLVTIIKNKNENSKNFVF